MTTSAAIHGSNVHSVNALVSVSAGGPWYPDARVSPPDASAVPMPPRYRRRAAPRRPATRPETPNQASTWIISPIFPKELSTLMRGRPVGQPEPPEPAWTGPMFMIATGLEQAVVALGRRSEERRVGEGGRSTGWA